MVNSRSSLIKGGKKRLPIIATGVITWDRLGSHLQIDTESAGATDDLDTINGGQEGDVIIVSSTNSSRVPTIKDATGNLNLSADFILTSPLDAMTLYYTGGSWLELSRSDNAT